MHDHEEKIVFKWHRIKDKLDDYTECYFDYKEKIEKSDVVTEEELEFFIDVSNSFLYYQELEDKFYNENKEIIDDYLGINKIDNSSDFLADLFKIVDGEIPF